MGCFIGAYHRIIVGYCKPRVGGVEEDAVDVFQKIVLDFLCASQSFRYDSSAKRFFEKDTPVSAETPAQSQAPESDSDLEDMEEDPEMSRRDRSQRFQRWFRDRLRKMSAEKQAASGRQSGSAAPATTKSPAEKETGSLLFSAGDLKDIPALVGKLNANSDSVSQFLRGQLSRQVHILKNPASTTEQLQAALVEGLNDVLKSGPIYDDRRFGGVKLSPKTRKLKQQDDPQGDQLIYFNRRLLQDAYPLELKPSVQFGSMLFYMAREYAVEILRTRRREVSIELPAEEDEDRGTKEFLCDAPGPVDLLAGAEDQRQIKKLVAEGMRLLRAAAHTDVQRRNVEILEAVGPLPPFRRKEGFPLFLEGDFINLSGLVGKLNAHSDLLSKFLLERLSHHAQVLTNPNSIDEQLESALIEGLNEILKHARIYDEQRFAGVKMSPETRRLMEQNAKDDDLIRFNRLILEDYYPGELKNPREVLRESYGISREAFDKAVHDTRERLRLIVEALLTGDFKHMDLRDLFSPDHE